MTLIYKVSIENIRIVNAQLKNESSGLPSVEAVAQRLTEIIFENFKESVVLVRAFLSVDFEELYENGQAFVISNIRKKEPLKQIRVLK